MQTYQPIHAQIYPLASSLMRRPLPAHATITQPSPGTIITPAMAPLPLPSTPLPPMPYRISPDGYLLGHHGHRLRSHQLRLNGRYVATARVFAALHHQTGYFLDDDAPMPYHEGVHASLIPEADLHPTFQHTHTHTIIRITHNYPHARAHALTLTLAPHQQYALFLQPLNPHYPHQPCAVSRYARPSTLPETDPQLLASIALRQPLPFQPLGITEDEILLPYPPPAYPHTPSSAPPPLCYTDLARRLPPDRLPLRPDRPVMINGTRYRAAQVAAAMHTGDMSFLDPIPTLALALPNTALTPDTMSLLHVPPVIHTPTPGYPDAHTIILSL